MGTYFTIWHYLFIIIAILIFIGGIVAAVKEAKPKVRNALIFSSFLVSLLIGTISIFVLDKYTKKAQLFDVRNKRLLSVEKIVYQGFVKNVGNYKIGTVKFEIKLVNRGNATGKIKGGSNFYKPSGFFDFIHSSGETVKKSKPQTVVKQFVVAKDLEPGKAKHFRVMFAYPPYFTAVSQYTKVYAH